jgi:hypothetical protein
LSGPVTLEDLWCAAREAPRRCAVSCDRDGLCVMIRSTGKPKELDAKRDLKANIWLDLLDTKSPGLLRSDFCARLASFADGRFWSISNIGNFYIGQLDVLVSILLEVREDSGCRRAAVNAAWAWDVWGFGQ